MGKQFWVCTSNYFQRGSRLLGGGLVRDQTGAEGKGPPFPMSRDARVVKVEGVRQLC
jgi:hypothetical protein